jgi:hypothetical protein
MSFRKEKKFRLSTSDMLKLKNELFKTGMTTLHKPRKVNSCYFDTQHLTLYHESEEGVLPRKKIRIRWYNNDKKFSKETKISSIEGRYKFSKKSSFITSIKELKNLKFFDNSYGTLHPRLIVKYDRSYYLFNNLRITFDRNISYNDLKSNSTLTYHDNECVMEVKVPIECNDDYIEKIIKYPTTRFSKYSRGLLFCNKSL